MKYKLVLFDMDGTLINGRSIFKFAEEKDFKEELMDVLKDDIQPYIKSVKIAKFLEGIKIDDLLEIFREIPLHNNVEVLLKELKKNNVKTAIVTDSYQFIADDLRSRLGIDFAFANNLLSKDGIITGDVIINNEKLINENIDNKIFSICKSCILEDLCIKLDIKESEVIAIGDGIVDICMLEKAGLGIAFNAPEKVQKYANVITNEITKILDYI